jgi:hypothetical protein
MSHVGRGDRRGLFATAGDGNRDAVGDEALHNRDGLRVETVEADVAHALRQRCRWAAFGCLVHTVSRECGAVE